MWDTLYVRELKSHKKNYICTLHRFSMKLLISYDLLLHCLAHLPKDLDFFLFHFSKTAYLLYRKMTWTYSYHILSQILITNLEKNGLKFLEAENILRLKVSRGWKCLEAEIVSGLKVSPNCSRGWKFLRTESFSQLKVSRSRKCLRAESVSRLKVSQSRKCLRAVSVSRLKVSRSRKCLRAEIVATESVSGLKVSFTLMAESVWRLKMSGLQISRDGNCLRAESVLETFLRLSGKASYASELDRLHFFQPITRQQTSQ